MKDTQLKIYNSYFKREKYSVLEPLKCYLFFRAVPDAFFTQWLLLRDARKRDQYFPAKIKRLGFDCLLGIGSAAINRKCKYLSKSEIANNMYFT